MTPDLRKPEFEHLFRDPRLRGLSKIAKDYAVEQAYLQYTEQAILAGMFGCAMGAVRTTISANTATTSSIATGSLANAGTSGNMDTTPTSTATVYNGHPAASPNDNVFTVVQSFTLTAAAATSVSFASITTGYAVTHNATPLLSDVIFVGGSATSGGLAGGTSPVSLGMYQDLYIGLTTAAYTPGSTSAATLTGSEPTSSNGYARIGAATTTPTPLFNNRTNFPLPTAATPSILTTANGPWSFAASAGGGWSSGATNLVTMFISDATTLGGGNLLAAGTLTVGQAVASAGITLSFATGAITLQLT